MRGSDAYDETEGYGCGRYLLAIGSAEEDGQGRLGTYSTVNWVDWVASTKQLCRTVLVRSYQSRPRYDVGLSPRYCPRAFWKVNRTVFPGRTLCPRYILAGDPTQRVDVPASLLVYEYTYIYICVYITLM